MRKRSKVNLGELEAVRIVLTRHTFANTPNIPDRQKAYALKYTHALKGVNKQTVMITA